jgi:Secretion system C-terminal sorting domain
MRNFSLAIPFSTGSLVVGWRYNSNGTAAPNPYRWQMDSIRFRSGVDIRLLSVEGVPAVASSCGSGSPLKIVYQNIGTVAVDTVFVGYQVGTATPFSLLVRRPLPPGAKDSAILAPVVYPGSGTWAVAVGAGARGDISTGDNSANFSTIYRGSTALPAAQYGNLNSLISAGFSSGSGPSGANPTPSFVGSTSYTSFNPTAAATVSSGTVGYEQIWLISPLYRGQNSATVNLRYRVSVTSGSTGTNLGAAIATDDSLAIYVKRNCGPWELVQAYTGADYTSGNISNALDPLRVVQLSQVAPSDSFQVAFKVSNGGTPPAQSYRWHLNFIYITDIVGTKASLQTLGLSLYPNPAQGVAYLMGIKGNTSVTISDVQGRVLRTLTTSEATSKIDLQGLAKGTYIIRAQTNEGAGLQRLVLE